MEDYIGVIVKNQWDEILLYESSFYIKIKKSDDVKNIIKKELSKNLNIDIFKIKKIYDEKLLHRQEELTLYLVEVGVYNKEFEFIKIEKVLPDILNFQDKEFFEKNILRYETYGFFLYSIINILLLIILVGILESINKPISMHSFGVIIGVLVLIFAVFAKFIKPKLLNYLINFEINIKFVEYLTTITMIVYWVKILTIVM
ncbi:hypothetical protein QOZ83_02615 [Romboutsia sedimentorum]|uniref:hypothetical protein n=1 Tax=Romboutsia sedimentorum TaxID=1368474 RepID=UPI0024DE28FC|nr:hypothetical protein [Romboutsia sedimentorum]MDK2584738.1 hypothetical protein [Romboutsia sedimentorum]